MSLDLCEQKTVGEFLSAYRAKARARQARPIVNADLVRRTVAPMPPLPEPPKPVVFEIPDYSELQDRIAEECCKHYGVSARKLKSRSRKIPVSYARKAFFYLVRHNCQITHPAIGRLVGGRDHSSVSIAIRTVSERPHMREAVRVIAAKNNWVCPCA